MDVAELLAEQDLGLLEQRSVLGEGVAVAPGFTRRNL
jgi:hypothetical protein